MKIGQVDLDAEVLVVAEIGNNHEGSLARAEELIGRAAEAGARAVKFQTFRTELFVSRSQPERFDRLKGFELRPADFERLAATARAAGLLFLSTPLDLDSVQCLDPLVAAFKIASADLAFYPLLEAVASHGKPVILSTGLADLAQIRRSTALLNRCWRQAGLDAEWAVLHCVCAYPTPSDQANLAAIRTLKRELACTVGYSDHTLGIDAAVLAVACGARIIEKHFTLDKGQSDFRDHQLSADPGDMRLLVQRVAEANRMLGSGDKGVAPCEEPLRVAVRRSVVVRRDLPAGALLSREAIAWVRPGGGLAPGEEQALLGRRLKRPLVAGERITPDAVE
jgi:N,N'-diacetyllegionaminate synthase